MPFVFVLDPLGVGILLAIPKGGTWWDIVWVTVLSSIALVALAGAAEGWLFKKTNAAERLLLLVAGLLLIYPKALFDAIGVVLLVVAVALQLMRGRRPAAAG